MPSIYTNQLQSAGDRHEILVDNLFKDMGNDKDNMMHAAAGIAGEAGELLDAVKKHWAYNKPLDIVNVVEELGDLEFYMRALRNLLEISREEILVANIAKLSKRYASGKYSDQQAQDRADKAEVKGGTWPGLVFPETGKPWGLTTAQLGTDFDKAVEQPVDPEIAAILEGQRL